MFDVTPDEISQLNDADLRELVGRLCEAELTSRQLSPSAVTWGGNQSAADGGLDVRVALPSDKSIDGFIPRLSTGFQVKKPDMPRADVLAEMRPKGIIRPVIRDLANEEGAYIIVSSTGSTADSALRNRQNALREALEDVDNAEQLYTDFYDRTRLATWVRCHPGLITWVKKKVGRTLSGWRPYGPWSGAAEDINAEYLIDDKLSLHLGRHRDEHPESVVNAIDELRDKLSCPGKMVRLVGLSGVGKTRLAQALFDARIGTRPLPPSLAVYTNLSDNPDPQPIGLASDLIANRTHAILVVDNCPPELHRSLSNLCSGQNSPISVLTIEYDVRGDQPEETHVVTLDTSSTELIKKLIQRRFPHLSQVDSRTIAEASGGNARIAIALAETVERTETISSLSNEELFQRLFRQRHDPNDDMLLAAKACSLVYSFQGEAIEGEDAELPRLASLVGQNPSETYRHVCELFRRNLVQQRGVWRAVLPHAIANRLASHALEEIPFSLINKQLVSTGNERLARSFSKRLSFMHDHPRAIAIAEGWLSTDGLLGDLPSLNELGRVMFENIAPVLPEATLEALERVSDGPREEALRVWKQHLSLLCSLAYDPHLFERSAQLLAYAATECTDDRTTKQASDTFVSLFTILLSGTHATIEQRLALLEQLLVSNEIEVQRLGLAALDNVLKTAHFSSGNQFEFGARSRDFGYRPRSNAEVSDWYRTTLSWIERLAFTEGVLKLKLRDLLAQNFRGLWASVHMFDELEKLAHLFASEGFWREGWIACKETLYFDRARLSPEAVTRLSALEQSLRPSNLLERVQAVVLGDRSARFDLEDGDDDFVSAHERLELTARKLGSEVALDDEVFEGLLPELFRNVKRGWSFGRGLADTSRDFADTWKKLVQGLERAETEFRNVQVLNGFLFELWEKDKDLVHGFLDTALEESTINFFLPELHSAIHLEERGVERLKQLLKDEKGPVSTYRNLAYGKATEHLDGSTLKELILLIADQSEGFDVALEIFVMRLHSDKSAKRKHDSKLLEAGPELLRRVKFDKGRRNEDYKLASVVKTSLTSQDAGAVASLIANRLRRAMADHETSVYDYGDLMTALFEVQPEAVLDALFEGDEEDCQNGTRVLEDLSEHRKSPADVITCETLVTWCEVEREKRYPLAASFIKFAQHQESCGTQVWSEQAKALLVNAPDPRGVLSVLIKRFYPMIWTGSRAALIEANAKLLDDLKAFLPVEIMPFVIDAKSKLAEEIAGERQWETKHDRTRDERFE
ncbi:MAG: hypothetical protein AB7F21_13145 [Desulfuromonadales bacterium]